MFLDIPKPKAELRNNLLDVTKLHTQQQNQLLDVPKVHTSSIGSSALFQAQKARNNDANQTFLDVPKPNFETVRNAFHNVPNPVYLEVPRQNYDFGNSSFLNKENFETQKNLLQRPNFEPELQYEEENDSLDGYFLINDLSDLENLQDNEENEDGGSLFCEIVEGMCRAYQRQK